MKQNDKFEEDMRQVEEILDRAKADLMNMLPEIESLEAVVTGKNGSKKTTDVPGVSKPENGNEPLLERSHFGVFRFLTNKP